MDDKTKKIILVVDNEPKIVEMIKWIFEEEGFNVITAFNGREALDKIREQSPDLLILDIFMPVMDGWQVCNEVRKDSVYCKLPIILITVQPTDKNQIKGLNAGADAFLPKPFDPYELISKTRQLLQ